MVIDGKKIAAGIIDRLKAEPKPTKFLAAIQVGDDPATASFIALKQKVAKQLGVDFRVYTFPATVTNDDLRKEFGKIAANKTCGGVMVELPLPESLNWYYALNAIPPEKDVDVLGERALGAFYVGRSKVLPPAVGTVEEILKTFPGEDSAANAALGFEKYLASKAVAIVGLGMLIGRPIAHWIMRRAKETILLRSTSGLTILNKADIIITGAGKAGLMHQEMLKENATVIDFGYDGGKGDFDATGVFRELAHTPTPGGTGPILVAKLFENFYKLNGGDGSEERA
jgi:methylenetetrahydrofolate dehydrogenase (NADP+) / methenyltetrahydrofolate cyclohydrolase